MSCFRKINEVTSEIVRCEGDIESFKYRLETLRNNKQPEVYAKLDLQVNGPRSAMTIWLNNDEVVSILKKRVEEKQGELKELKKEYNTLKK